MAKKIENLIIHPSRIVKIIKSRPEEKRNYLESLKGLPYESEVFSVVELKQLK